MNSNKSKLSIGTELDTELYVERPTNRQGRLVRKHTGTIHDARVPYVGHIAEFKTNFPPTPVLCSSISAINILEMSARLSSADDYAKLLDQYDTWMFDCDGVLWHGDRLEEGAVEVLAMLRSHSMSTKLSGFFFI